MEISGVSIPVSHEVPQEPPRNAQLQSAVREAPPAQQQGSDPDSDGDAGREQSETNLGRHVNEHA